MGNLPKSKVGTRTLVLGGEKVEVRGLLRRELGEVLAPVADGTDDPSARERCDALTVALGCQVTEEEAAEWMAAAPGGHVVLVIQAVMELSGMGDEEGKG
jgi:hypothetical protein